jgi:hypothetical protein
MCKYSLEQATAQFGTTDAAQGDNLEIRDIRGFTKVDDNAIVCLRNGTELVLSGESIDFQKPGVTWDPIKNQTLKDEPVTFEEREVPTYWHGGRAMTRVMDILVKPDGTYTMVHYLTRGSTARVLQVPPVDVAAPVPAHELEHAD